MSKPDKLAKEAALGIALRSPIMSFKTGCVIVTDDDVFTGWSHRSHISLKSTPWSMHAELHALKRARWDVEGATVYVANISARGNITTGRPCRESCWPLMEKLKIEKVIYTTPEGWVQQYV
jgi:pyrimidine deaminase RibD-like protein